MWKAVNKLFILESGGGGGGGGTCSYTCANCTSIWQSSPCASCPIASNRTLASGACPCNPGTFDDGINKVCGSKKLYLLKFLITHADCVMGLQIHPALIVTQLHLTEP